MNIVNGDNRPGDEIYNDRESQARSPAGKKRETEIISVSLLLLEQRVLIVRRWLLQLLLFRRLATSLFHHLANAGRRRQIFRIGSMNGLYRFPHLVANEVMSLRGLFIALDVLVQQLLFCLHILKVDGREF